MYDVDLIYSWTMREFNNFIKGAQLRNVDSYELQAAGAMFNAKVKSKKRIKFKDIYDAEKARKEIIGDKPKQTNGKVDMKKFKAMQTAMKNYNPNK